MLERFIMFLLRSRSIFQLFILLILTIVCVESKYLISVSSNITANESQSVTLACKAYNNLTAKYTLAWRRSEVVITERKAINRDNLKRFIDEDDIDRYKLQGFPIGQDVTEYRLVINDLKKEDIDDYACSLCKRPYSSYSCMEPLDIKENLAVTLDVMYTPGQLICSKLQKYHIGVTINIECVSEEGKPPVDLQFTINGNVLEGADSTSTSLSSQDGILRITHSIVVSESNIGEELGCNSTSKYFTNFLNSCTHGKITVQDTPDLTLKSSLSEPFSIGENISFICSAKSRSDINYFDWTTNPKSVKDRMRIETDLSGLTSILTLDKMLMDDDQTRVNCTVANKAGEINTISTVIYVKHNVISPTISERETMYTSVNQTHDELKSVYNDSNRGLIAGIILTVCVLILVSGIAGYLLFVRRRREKTHQKLPLDETSSTIKSDQVWSEDEEVDKNEGLQLKASDSISDRDYNEKKEHTQLSEKSLEYDDDNIDFNENEDDVFVMNVTRELPVPTHV